MAGFHTLDDADFAGRRVLVRVDLNVPLQHGAVADATRIDAAVPTIREIVDAGGMAILLAHFGRPKGRRDPSASLAPVRDALARALGRPVGFAEDCIGPAAEAAVASMRKGDVLLLENTRFHAGEEKNDPGFAEALASLGELYVDDAFSAAHRAHASTEGITRFLPSFAGRAMAHELAALEQALGDPRRPVLAIVGGAKVSTKLALLENLTRKVDGLVIGGAMANTFLLAAGVPVGRSLAEPDLVETARRIQMAEGGAEIAPVLDVVVAAELKPRVAVETVPATAIPPDRMVLDFGPETVAEIKRRIDAAATLVWNGPLGAFEIEPFDRATMEVARHVAARTRAGKLLSVAGGGDTVSALNQAGVADDFTYVSTAGGAFLEWMEGKDLPGVEALRRR